MDRDVAAMKEKQEPRDPNYLPPGVKPDVALAAEVVTGVTAPKLAFATGTPGSTYMSLCDKLKENAAATLEIDCLAAPPAAGENVMDYLARKDQAIFATADVIDWAMRARSAGGNGPKTFGRYQLTAYSEAMFLLVNKESTIHNVSDLKPGATLYVGPAGSGTEVSFENLAHHASKRSWVVFQAHNAQYEGVRIENAPYPEAIDAVAKDPDAVMLVMMPGHSEFMSKVDQQFGDRVRLVSMSGDPSFTKVTDRDGNFVYHEVAGARRRALSWKLLGPGAVRTLCVPAIVVVSGDWVRENGRTGEDSAPDRLAVHRARPRTGRCRAAATAGFYRVFAAAQAARLAAAFRPRPGPRIDDNLPYGLRIGGSVLFENEVPFIIAKSAGHLVEKPKGDVAKIAAYGRMPAGGNTIHPCDLDTPSPSA